MLSGASRRETGVKKVLFWDFDGTLIHSNESFADSLDLALKAHGYAMAPAEIRSLLRRACSWVTPEIAYENETGPKWWDRLFERFETFYALNQIPNSAWAGINACFRNRILDYRIYDLYDDAEAVLNECKGLGYANYVLSNNFPELEGVVVQLGLSGYFEGCIVSSNVGFEKPRAEIFEHALAVAGYPDVCYMIGDNPVADIGGARAVGIKTVFVHGGPNRDATVCCDRLSQIPALLGA